MLKIICSFTQISMLFSVLISIFFVQLVSAATVNVALNKTAYQSSTHSVGEPSRAVDGNINGKWRHNSVSHTLAGDEPWLEVDLEASYKIDGIAIWNRTDCCRERLSNYYVFVKNSPFVSDTIEQLVIEAGVTSLHQTTIPQPRSYIDLREVEGRYVRVQKIGPKALHIAELEVFANDKQVLPNDEIFNVALNKPAYQSSLYKNAVASRAVDGHTNGKWRDRSIAHTLTDKEPWLEVDLEASYDIDNIAVWNRTDCCKKRLKNYYVFIKNTPFNSTSIADLLTEPGVTSFHKTSKPSPSATIQVNNIVGRYIRIQKVGQGPLNLAELQIFAADSATSTQPELANVYNHILPIDVPVNAQGLPILHSLPSATTQVYLDFDGDDGKRVPFDLDNDPSTFNYEEQTYIFNWWRSTAAHFSMFDINVTTELDIDKPHSWNVISPNGPTGVAWGKVGFRKVPIAAMTSRHGPYSTVVGHEGGHTFGLPHVIGIDKQGNMNRPYYPSPYALRGWHLGAGDRIVNKWSNKFHLNKIDKLFGDVEQISSRVKALDSASTGFRHDDHNGNFELATLLKPTSHGYFANKGVIETMDDHDLFYIDWLGGSAIIHTGNIELSPVNLNIALYDVNQKLITRYQNGENHQFLSVELEPGRYYIDASSAGRYSDLGEYQISMTPAPNSWQVANIGPKRSIAPISYSSSQKQWRVKATGGDVWNSTDNAVLLHKTTHGDAEIIARVDELTSAASRAKAGISFRASLEDEAAHISLLHSSKSGLGVFIRTQDGAATTIHNQIRVTSAKWIKLTRSNLALGNDSFTAAISNDGVNWQEIGSHTLNGLPKNMYTGLIHGARHRTRMMTTTISQVTINNLDTRLVDDNLSMPTNVTIIANAHDSVSLNWLGDSQADSYIVERSDDGFNFQQIGRTDKTNFVDLSVNSAHTYHYRVRSVLQEQLSTPSTSVMATLRAGAVIDLRAISFGPNGMLLDWAEPLGQRGYKIERSENGSDFYTLAERYADFDSNLVAQSFANSQKYVDSNLDPATTYYYRVTTIDSLGESASATDSNSTRLQVPTNIAVVDASTQGIEFQWQDVEKAREYQIEALINGEWKVIAIVDANTTSYRHSNLAHSSLYKYRVKAISDTTSSGYVEFSAATLAQTQPTSPWRHHQINSSDGVANQDQADSFTLVSKTDDIWRKSDSLQLVSQSITGDFDVQVKVEQLDHTSRWSKAGIMARDSLAHNDAYVANFITGSQGVGMQWRPILNHVSQYKGAKGAELKAPYWVRLVRQGDVFTSYHSKDGMQWQMLESVELKLEYSLEVGIAHTSNNRSTRYGVAKFSNLKID